MEGEARVSVQPLPHFRMLVGGVVVEDNVHDLSGRHLRLDGVEEADKLLVTMALHAAANDLAFEDIESGEQRRCAMSFVVVGHRAGAALLHRQAGLRAVERLDLRLFVDREDDGMGGRIDIKADHVAQLVDELRVVGELELLNPVWLETMRVPDALKELALMPTAFAIIEAVQWVASTGGSVRVSATTRSAISEPSGGIREGRVLSRRRPS